MAKHIISTFSYPLGEDETIRKAASLAGLEGKSLSALVVKLLKDYVRKNVEAAEPG